MCLIPSCPPASSIALASAEIASSGLKHSVSSWYLLANHRTLCSILSCHTILSLVYAHRIYYHFFFNLSMYPLCLSCRMCIDSSSLYGEFFCRPRPYPIFPNNRPTLLNVSQGFCSTTKSTTAESHRSAKSSSLA